MGAACLSSTACVPPLVSNDQKHIFLLTNKQLDDATAGSGELNLDLAAFAAGSTVTTSVQGSIRTGQTNILLVEITPATSSASRAKLIGVAEADLIFASGSASATGDIAANCSAQARLDGQVAFFAHTSSMTLTPNSVNCACSAFAVNVSGFNLR